MDLAGGDPTMAVLQSFPVDLKVRRVGLVAVDRHRRECLHRNIIAELKL